MKRKILFRGKRVDNGEWIYGSLLNGGGDCEISDHNDITFSRYDVISETVGQYSGKDDDTNESKIYEDDLIDFTFDGVRFCDSGYPVKVEDGCFIIQTDRSTLLLSELGAVEITGNIHDNK